MRTSKHGVMLVALVLTAVLALPLVAEAATIYVNSGVSGAKIGMKDTTASKKLGKVKKKKKVTAYGGQTWVRFYGKKSKGKYALEMYSNTDHKVIAFVANSKKYVTKKKIHVRSTSKSLRAKYKSKLKKEAGGYYLKGKVARTHFEVSKGKITSIWIW